MTRVLISLGSNLQAADNLGYALDSLLLRFGDVALSPVFESAASGNAGSAAYLNMSVALNTDLSLAELNTLFKALEAKLGRQRDTDKALGVPLDIDILTYGNQTGRSGGITLPRPELTEAAYVLWPVAVMVPKERHPVLKQTYSELWKAFDMGGQTITPVNFFWHGRQISSAALQ